MRINYSEFPIISREGSFDKHGEAKIENGLK